LDALFDLCRFRIAFSFERCAALKRRAAFHMSEIYHKLRHCSFMLANMCWIGYSESRLNRDKSMHR
jgi:hypothetical protein